MTVSPSSPLKAKAFKSSKPGVLSIAILFFCSLSLTLPIPVSFTASSDSSVIWDLIVSLIEAIILSLNSNLEENRIVWAFLASAIATSTSSKTPFLES